MPPESTVEVPVETGIPDYLMFGVEAEPPSPPLPTADAATKSADAAAAGAAPVSTSESAKGEAASQEQTAGAQPAPEAGAKPAEATESADPELSAEDNKQLQSLPEAERPAAAGKMKAASWWSQFYDINKPAEEKRQHLEDRSKSVYDGIETATVLKVATDPQRLARIFKSGEEGKEAYGKFSIAAYNADPEFWHELATGKKGVTAEQLKSALEQSADPANKIPGADALTDEEIEEIEFSSESAAAKLKAAREAAKLEAAKVPEAKPEEKPAAPTPEKIIEEYQTAQQTFTDTFVHGITPMADYLEKRFNDALGAEPTESERTLSPEVASLKDVLRDVLLVGAGKDLPPFNRGLLQWGEHRKLGKNGERDFDQAYSRVRHFATKGEKDGAAEAAKEMIPFADAYLNERLNSPIIKALNSAIALLAEQGNQTPRTESHIPGSANSQPPSQPKLTGTAYLLQHAQEHS